MNTSEILKLGVAALISGMIVLPTSTILAQPDGPCREGKSFIQRFDADGDGKVSRDEFPSPERRFELMDSNGDGFLDASEVAQAHPRRGQRGDRLMQRFDSDGDGKLSKAELPTPETFFASLDTNGDGYIDAAEAAKAHPRHGKRGEHLIQRFDANGDGKLSLDEFPSPENRFAKLDTNGDGYIDESEGPRWRPHHGKRCGNFIKDLDRDGDGRVSQGEFPGPSNHFTQLDTNGDGFIDATEVPKGPPLHKSMMEDDEI